MALPTGGRSWRGQSKRSLGAKFRAAAVIFAARFCSESPGDPGAGAFCAPDCYSANEAPKRIGRPPAQNGRQSGERQIPST